MLKHIRPPIFANALRQQAHGNSLPLSIPQSLDPCGIAPKRAGILAPYLDPSIPRSLDPSIPAALVRAQGDCRPNGYYDWTPGGQGGNPPESRRPERHGARHALGALILLGVTVAVWGLLFVVGLLFAVYGK